MRFSKPIIRKEQGRRIYSIAKEEGIIRQKNELGFKHLPGFKDDVRVRIPSIEKAKSILGWEPMVALNEALEMCIQKVAEVYSLHRAD